MSFNRVGNAPRVQRRGIVSRRTTRGALPTRLNESALTARGIVPDEIRQRNSISPVAMLYMPPTMETRPSRMSLLSVSLSLMIV